eukprot:4230833-Amphidinium_carterae.2
MNATQKEVPRRKSSDSDELLLVARGALRSESHGHGHPGRQTEACALVRVAGFMLALGSFCARRERAFGMIGVIRCCRSWRG